jgi:hypothetical protein
MNASQVTQAEPRYELRFQSLSSDGRTVSFDCDARGCVPLDRLSEKARIDYFYARAMVGRDYATPALRTLQ